MIQVFHTLAEARSALPACVLTIGKYDGMHLGHQKILKALQSESDRLGVPAMVLLSEPQPEEFFAGEQAPPRLTQFHEKVALLEAFGVPAVYRLAFDATVSQQPPSAFVDGFLCTGLGMRGVVVGEDFRFGHRRSGSVETLRLLGAQHGFDVVAVSPCIDADERISSTAIRQYLQAGDCRKVGQFLGRPYTVTGPIVQGLQLGRQLGFPTANVELGPRRLPMAGIFVVEARVQGRWLPGVASLGLNPTVSATDKVKLEVHLLDFHADLYGQTMEVAFLHKLRDEERYTSLEQLKARIAADVEQARVLLRDAVWWPVAARVC